MSGVVRRHSELLQDGPKKKKPKNLFIGAREQGSKARGGGAVRLTRVLNRHPSLQKHLLKAGVPAVTPRIVPTLTTRWHHCSSQPPWVGASARGRRWLRATREKMGRRGGGPRPCGVLRASSLLSYLFTAHFPVWTRTQRSRDPQPGHRGVKLHLPPSHQPLGTPTPLHLRACADPTGSDPDRLTGGGAQ